MSKAKIIVHIAYDQTLMFTRATLLQRHGFEVISVMGNEVALDTLHPGAHYDLFLIGHAAPQEQRIEMAQWLKARYPGTTILAINPPDHPQLQGADFNVELNGPETWLAMVSVVLSNTSGKA